MGSLCSFLSAHCPFFTAKQHGMEFCGYDRDNVIKIVRQFHTILKKFQVRMKSLERPFPSKVPGSSLPCQGHLHGYPKEPRCDVEPEKCSWGAGEQNLEQREQFSCMMRWITSRSVATSTL